MNLTELDAIRASVEDLDVMAGQLVLDRNVELKMAAMTGDDGTPGPPRRS